MDHKNDIERDSVQSVESEKSSVTIKKIGMAIREGKRWRQWKNSSNTLILQVGASSPCC